MDHLQVLSFTALISVDNRDWRTLRVRELWLTRSLITPLRLSGRTAPVEWFLVPNPCQIPE